MKTITGKNWLLRIESRLETMNDEAHIRIEQEMESGIAFKDCPSWQDVSSTGDGIETVLSLLDEIQS